MPQVPLHRLRSRASVEHELSGWHKDLDLGSLRERVANLRTLASHQSLTTEDWAIVDALRTRIRKLELEQVRKAPIKHEVWLITPYGVIDIGS